MTLKEAAAKGIAYVRKPIWADPKDYVKLDLIGGLHGPWGHLYSPLQKVIGEPTPQDFLLIEDNSTDWETYTGELP